LPPPPRRAEPAAVRVREQPFRQFAQRIALGDALKPVAKLYRVEAIAHEDRSHPVQPERIGDPGDHAAGQQQRRSIRRGEGQAFLHHGRQGIYGLPG